MEGAWQRNCDSQFQPSTSATVSSAPSLEPKDMNASCLYPQVALGLRSKFDGWKQGPLYPSFPLSTTHGSGQADPGNSFPTLLYGPPSLFQYDSQNLSERKLCISSGDSTVAIGNSIFGSIEGGTFRTSSVGLITESLINRNLQSWVNNFPEISSRAMVGLNHSSNSVFNNIQSSNIATQHTVPGGEKARESFSFPGQWRGTGPASSLNVRCSNIQTTRNIVLERCSSNYATPFISGCPRVFCMGKSGHLLLSHTGLLGVVCSCHCCHMSVLKFCEHSGLQGVDPGDAVCMESGETISRWRKLYFLKFGIRSLGNENEWDWPEVLSTTGSPMKPNASAFDMSKTNLSHMLSSSAVKSRSEKSSDYAMFPNNSHMDHNLFIGELSRKQPTIIKDGGHIPLKGFTGILQSSFYDQLKNQLMESNLAMYTTAPNFVGTQPDDGCHPIPAFFYSLRTRGNLSTAHSPLQTPTSLLKDHDCIKKKSANDGLVGRDAASSNVDLRLGQPPQPGNPLPSFIEPLLFNADPSPPKLQPQKHMSNSALNQCFVVADCLSMQTSARRRNYRIIFKMVEELPQLKPKNYMSAVSKASAKARAEADNVAEGLLVSPFAQIDTPGVKTQASENLWNDYSPIIHKKFYSDYGHTGRQSNKSVVGTNKYLDSNKGVSFAKDSGAKINSGFGISQLMEYPSSIMRAGGGYDSCISIVNEKMYESNYESSLPSESSVGANILRGRNGYCHLCGLSPTPLHGKVKESQCKHSYDLQNKETSLSLGITKDNIRSSAYGKCSEQPSNTCMEGNYPCAARVNCCRSNFFSGTEPLCYNLRKQLVDASGETSPKMPSDLTRNLIISNDRNIHFEQGGKLHDQGSTKIGFHTPQWRDVPSNVRKAVCDATSFNQTTTGLDWEGQEGFQPGNISMKRSKRMIYMGDVSKEQENSNVSSGCSAPVVNQASLVVNKIDYCAKDAVDTGLVNNLVVDEGSGIDQGSLSDLVVSERTDEFLGSTTGSDLKNGCSKVLNDESCCNLLDDLKLLDSLIWKKEMNQNHFVLSAANCVRNQIVF
ncbi:unnamed protein product [Sphenostylis stenocarpa]|uniref:Tify domain-containing protein n=1 Tax=Sphenostylis stenocarpa TaxID=92480 RepID=A0AA86VNS7_9FABA|nr:unnamed protein product [Sphenostylis stenocarpa]